MHNGAFVWRTLQRLGIPESDLDDCLQEVLLVVHRRLDTYDPDRAKLTTWLFGICIRVAKRHRRRWWGRRDATASHAGEAVAPATPAEEYDRAELRERLRRAMDAMDVDKRAALVLYELEGMKTEAIAELMGVPVGTVHSRLFSARKQLSRKLRLEPPRRRQASGCAGVLPISLALQELHAALPPLRPLPAEVHVRALAQATQLAASPASSLLAVLGGNSLLAAIPTGALVLGIGLATHRSAVPPAAPTASLVEPTLAVAAESRDRPAEPPIPTRTAAAPPAADDAPLALEDLPPAPTPFSPLHSPASAPPASPTPSPLGVEAELVAAARRQLARDPAAALRLSRDYAARFPDGQLRSAAECIAVEALTRLGRSDQAQARARKLVSIDPAGLYSRQALAVAQGNHPRPRRAPH